APAFGPLESKEPVFHRELLGQKLVEEGHVVVILTNLEDPLLPEPEAQVPVPALGEVITSVPLSSKLTFVPTLLDVPEQLDAEFVGVQLAPARRHHARIVIRVVYDFTEIEDMFGHQL